MNYVKKKKKFIKCKFEKEIIIIFLMYLNCYNIYVNISFKLI